MKELLVFFLTHLFISLFMKEFEFGWSC